MNRYETFLQLHQAATPLLLGNCWDVSSAKILEAKGFKAIATSSMAVAQSLDMMMESTCPLHYCYKLQSGYNKI